MKFLDKTNYARVFFGVLISVIYAGVLIALITYPIPESNRSAVDILIGSIGTMLGMVYAFYFGTSDGSVKKSNIIEKMQQSSPKNQTIINDSNIETVLDEDPSYTEYQEEEIDEITISKPAKPVKKTSPSIMRRNNDDSE